MDGRLKCERDGPPARADDRSLSNVVALVPKRKPIEIEPAAMTKKPQRGRKPKMVSLRGEPPGSVILPRRQLEWIAEQVIEKLTKVRERGV